MTIRMLMAILNDNGVAILHHESMPGALECINAATGDHVGVIYDYKDEFPMWCGDYLQDEIPLGNLTLETLNEQLTNKGFAVKPMVENPDPTVLLTRLLRRRFMSIEERMELLGSALYRMGLRNICITWPANDRVSVAFQNEQGGVTLLTENGITF